MPAPRNPIFHGTRALAVLLVAVASLGLSLRVAETLFRRRHGLDGEAPLVPILMWLGVIAIGTILHGRSRAA